MNISLGMPFGWWRFHLSDHGGSFLNSIIVPGFTNTKEATKGLTRQGAHQHQTGRARVP